MGGRAGRQSVWGHAMTAAQTRAPALSVRLLGRLEIVACDRPVRLAGRHAQALAALLALRPRPRLRDAIAADLWPDFDGPSASSGLGACGVDPDAILEVGQDTLGLRQELALNTDVASFESLVADGPHSAGRALGLYRGDLAEGLGHECFAADRERLSDLYEDALVAVAEARLAAGDYAGAREVASLALARDPLREEAHIVLIAAYGQAGSRSQVVRQYRRVCEVLRTELAVGPLPETEATYRAALAATVRRSKDRAASIAAETDRRGPRRVFDRSTLTRVLAPSA
jgi:DNA-binding SARP family transcriptional activator